MTNIITAIKCSRPNPRLTQITEINRTAVAFNSIEETETYLRKLSRPFPTRRYEEECHSPQPNHFMLTDKSEPIDSIVC